MRTRVFGGRDSGFTLLEMAVVLVIVGLLSGIILRSEKVTRPDDCYAQTRAQIETIQQSVNAFALKNGRYPLPALRTLGVNDPGFGQEAALANLDKDAAGKAYFGALPFQALGLPLSFAADCWGNKYSYGVTATMVAWTGTPPASPLLGTTNTGAFTLLSDRGGATLTSDAAYMVASHGVSGGEAGNGAVSRNYSQAAANWCSASATGPLDHYNCALSTTLYSATFNNGSNAGAKFFDDVVVVGSKPGQSCSPNGQTVSWTVGALNCTASITGSFAMNQTTSVTSTQGVLSATGSGTATFKCNNGLMGPNAEAAPVATCTASATAGCGTATTSGATYSNAPTTSELCDASSTATGTPTLSGLQWSWSCKNGADTKSCTANYNPPSHCDYVSGPNKCLLGWTLGENHSTYSSTCSLPAVIIPPHANATLLYCWQCVDPSNSSPTEGCSDTAKTACDGGTTVGWDGIATGCSATIAQSGNIGDAIGPIDNTVSSRVGTANFTCQATAQGNKWVPRNNATCTMAPLASCKTVADDTISQSSDLTTANGCSSGTLGDVTVVHQTSPGQWRDTYQWTCTLGASVVGCGPARFCQLANENGNIRCL